jgi:hypothetical protein
MHFWHKKDIDDWYQETEERKTAEIVVNKPKLLLAHEDDNTTSSLFRVTKGYSLDLVYILKLIDEGHDIHELYAQSAKMEF